MSDTILTDKILKSYKDKNQKEKENEKERENGNENEDYDHYENKDEDDDETISQNEKNEIIKGENDILDKIIDKSKLFEEQIKSLKKEKI